VLDLTVEGFAAENAALLARIADLEADMERISELLHAALDQLHAALRRADNLDASNRRLMGWPDKYGDAPNDPERWDS
jgi:hypothetical protein